MAQNTRADNTKKLGLRLEPVYLEPLAGYYDVSMFRDAKRSFLTHTCDEPNGLAWGERVCSAGRAIGYRDDIIEMNAMVISELGSMLVVQP